MNKKCPNSCEKRVSSHDDVARDQSHQLTTTLQGQPTRDDPAGTRLPLGMDTPYVGSALQVEQCNEREFMGDTRGEDMAVRAGITLTPSRLQSNPLGLQDPGQSSSQGLTALTQNVISGKAVHLGCGD